MSTINIEHMVNRIQFRLQALPVRNTAAVRALRREFSKRLMAAEPRTVLDVSYRLLHLSQYLYRFIAYELIAHHRATLGSLKIKQLELLGKSMDSWGAVDTFACYLAGPAWRENQIADAGIHRWTRSTDRWWRRAALVSTVPLNNKTRGGKGDTQRTLEVCRLLMADRDDMVVKALSWALRELAKRDARSVRAFLQENQSRLPPRVIREVHNKLRTGLKNPPSHAP